MPSSSTRNTTQELTLQVSWRIAYTHLHDLGAHAFAEWVTEGFAVVLDIGSEDLISSAGTREHGRDDCNDRQVSDAIRAQGARMSEAEQVEAAATACMEAAEALGQFGREKEGEDFVEMGRELHELAVRLWNASRKESSSSGSASVSTEEGDTDGA